MPIPVAAAIAAGAQLVGTGATAYAQGRMNKKTRQWNEKMHDITRAESLSDWEMQNEYNSPREQMARYRDAGLNPALIYGQSNEGATVRSPETPSWNPRAPNYQMDAAPVLQAYYDTRLKEAQIDLLTSQNTVQVQEAALKAQQTAATAAGTSKTEFELSQARNLAGISLQTAQAQLEKIRTDTTFTTNQDARSAASNATSIQEALTRIASMKLQQLQTKEQTENVKVERQKILKSIEEIKQSMEIRNEDLKLKKDNIQPGDWIWWRKIQEYMKKLSIDQLTPAPFRPKLDNPNR